MAAAVREEHQSDGGAVAAIAEFFGISPSYLIDPEVDPKIEAQLELIQVLRDAGIRDLAMRASGLTPEAIDSLGLWSIMRGNSKSCRRSSHQIQRVEMAVSNDELLALARQLPIPVPWDREEFIANIAAERGRSIRLVPTDTAALDGGPCGLWLASDDEDVILHETGTSDYHIDQIVCHEIGHMLLGHGRGHADDHAEPAFDRLDELLPDIDPATVRAILGRTDFRADQERDAEMFASMIMIAAAEGATKKSVLRSIFLYRQ